MTKRDWKADPVTDRQISMIQNLIFKKLERGSKSFSDTGYLIKEKVNMRGETMTKGYASALIDKLIKMDDHENSEHAYQNRQRAAAKGRNTVRGEKSVPTLKDIEPGIYVMSGNFYKVQTAIYGSGNLYAKKLMLVWKDSKEPLTDEELTWFSDPEVAQDYKKGGEHYGEIVGRFVKETGAITQLRAIENEARLATLEESKEFGQLYGICCLCGRLLTDEDSIAAGIGPICAGKYFN